ncbi:hypothetical protein DICPUDRAFT_152279 [Dictyostelium purpureum]|uniref:Protein kinase domain-containing protein n=1 Tax=Dictyostelium purpureum TaxID=5786 RepID=F0ZKY1_DICPU|nr:uncharacterized protein DICPUDRAFT_152279 [Dictyostelium purpureum]EGC35395.1 hypothetical protein DICPUDRAFT_152279 [Dictyostelium purpureum]|eukprot:XP_003288071.1 hypothetical protein DICPUDRAFT_152279 [Dictyostelium purpureum]
MEAYFSKRENLPIPFPALQSELGQMIENSSNKGYVSSRGGNNEDKRKKHEQKKKEAASAPEMKATRDRFMETMNEPNSFRNFQSFMQNTLSTEYLNFFMEIDRYKNIDDGTKLKFTFDEIWRRFFDPDSNTPLYIESSLRRVVESQRSNPTHDSFNEVYDVLLHDIVCDSFKNYLTSPFNPDWRLEMNKKMKTVNTNNNNNNNNSNNIASTSNIASTGNNNNTNTNTNNNNKDSKEHNHNNHHHQNRERFDNYNKERREREREKEKEKEREREKEKLYDLENNLSNHSNSSSGSGRDNIDNVKSPTTFNNILQSPQTVSKVHEIYYKDSTNSLAISITLDNEEEPSIFHLDSSDMESLIEEVVKDNITVHTEINYNEVSLHKWIASGASGKVYNGQYKGKDVAIKVLGPEVCVHFDLNEFKREVALMSIFKHDNLVRCLGAGSYGDNYFHITDYCHNGTLSNHLKDPKNHISNSLKLHFALGIAKGMRYLHSMSIIHRDLKTMNILLTKRLKIKIVDFGTSRVANKNMTSHVGTQAWMAPEIFTSKSYTQKVDVYSYAIVLLEIFTRKSAYDDNSNIPFLVCKGERPEIPKDIPTPISNLIKKCWSQKPSHRPSFIKIAAYLESIIYPSISNSLGLVASTSFSSSALWSGKILATPSSK